MGSCWATDHRSIVRVSTLLLFFAHFIAQAKGSTSSTAEEYKPVTIGPREYRVLHQGQVDDDDGRRRLAPFQLCLLCKCCTTSSAGTASACTTMPCCFGIDCQLPNKPYGVCAFVPKTCNCNSCAS